MKEKIILASSSPRRSEILKSAGIDFEVISKEIDETINYDLSHEDIVVDIAIKKALEVYKDNVNRLILSCDTLVFLNEEVLQKPIDKKTLKKCLKN